VKLYFKNETFMYTKIVLGNSENIFDCIWLVMVIVDIVALPITLLMSIKIKR